MTNPPPTKSQEPAAIRARSAGKTRSPLAVVRPKDDAEGVLSSLPCTALAEGDAGAPAAPWVVGALEIRVPYRGTPTARSWCSCGRDRTVRGADAVRELVDAHAYHRTVCHLHNLPERRTAA
ncbi:hypothetical protein [Streptomyces chartreusis]|uniref:hypothetical protein n=1 Tax=Streptomyces chartreusis TaxID=1969 RepID=UPI003866BBC8|nr:hypothetical protein OG938_28305 [Streptomyces chartreusis]